jgi:hypothetical protein
MGRAKYSGMPEAGPRVPLERFSLVSKGDVYCVVDIVEDEVASILLTALPDHPVEVGREEARKLVAAWRQSGELNPGDHDVREERIQF